MHHKSFAILFLLAVLLTSPATPAHADSITIDGAGRAINVGAAGSLQSSASSSLGLFSDVVTASATTSTLELSATASQVSNISFINNDLLIMQAVGLASTQTVFLTPYNPTDQPQYFAGSAIAFQFTVDNWASFDTETSFSTTGNSWGFFRLVNSITNETLFEGGCSLSCQSNFSGSGILSPGSYFYQLDALDPEHLDPTSGNSAYATSFMVQIVPEPSSLLLLACGLALLAGWRFRKSAM